MKLKARSLKTLIILGAGATRGALSRTKSPGVAPPLDADYFDILRKFIQTREGRKHFKAYGRLDSFLQNEIGKRGIDKPTMERIFNVLFISKDLPAVFKKARGRARSSGFRQEVKDFLSLLIKVFCYVQSNCTNRDGIEHHRIIASSLEDGDVIMTLNYDTLMDNTLVRMGWNPKRGYGFTAQYVDVEIPKQNSFSPFPKDVILLKPHGSFNWYAKGKFNKLETALESRPVSKIIISDLPRLYEQTQKKLVRFFIPPLYTKFFTNKLWSKLWEQTYYAARRADRLVIVGCSLIASDYHLRAILSKAITDKGTRYKEIIIADKSKDTQKKLKQFFRGRSDKGCKSYSTFSEFCVREF